MMLVLWQVVLTLREIASWLLVVLVPVWLRVTQCLLSMHLGAGYSRAMLTLRWAVTSSVEPVIVAPSVPGRQA